MSQAIVTVLLVWLSTACGGDAAKVTDLFPADYATSYVQVRPCRMSPDHDSDNVLVFADPALAAEPYQMRDQPFPTGSIVVKEEHGILDAMCTGSITQWTVMVKLADGSSPATLDWHWQRVDKNRDVVTDDDQHCIACHMTCGVPPDGYLDTCSVPN